MALGQVHRSYRIQCIDVGAVLEQDLYTLGKILADGKVQRRVSGLNCDSKGMGMVGLNQRAECENKCSQGYSRTKRVGKKEARTKGRSACPGYQERNTRRCPTIQLIERKII